MTRTKRDLFDAVHEMAEGIPSDGTMDRSTLRDIEDMAGGAEGPDYASIEAMNELRPDRGRAFVSLEDFLADLSDD